MSEEKERKLGNVQVGTRERKGLQLVSTILRVDLNNGSQTRGARIFLERDTDLCIQLAAGVSAATIFVWNTAPRIMIVRSRMPTT